MYAVLYKIMGKAPCQDYTTDKESNYSAKLSRTPLPDFCGVAPFDNYIQTHKSILSGARKPRFTVVVALEAGVADRLLGTLTGLYYSIFTDRAIRFVTYGDLPPLESTFDTAYVDWHSPPYDDELIDHVKYTYKGQKNFHGDRNYPDYIDANKYYPFYMTNEEYYTNQVFLQDDPADHPAGHTHVETIFMAMNRGKTYRMFDNKHVSEKLYAMGLRPEVALSCAFHLLYKPNALVQAKFASVISTLRDPEPLKIGIMVRVADTEFSGDYDMARAAMYFKCAEEVEATRKKPGQKVIWHLLSASLSLRQQAKALYGDKLLTDITTSVLHTDFSLATEDKKALANETMRQALGEMVTFSLNDYFVYTKYSGFAQMGAFIAGKRRNKYIISDGIYDIDSNLTTRSCGVNDYDDEYFLSGLWSGI